MTKEKAIAILNLKAMNATGILGVLDPNCGEAKALREEIEALDMAMESLKGSTIENNSIAEIYKMKAQDMHTQTIEKALARLKELDKRRNHENLPIRPHNRD